MPEPMTAEQKYESVVKAFDDLEKWAREAKKLLEQIRDDPDSNARIAVSAKCLIWNWKGSSDV